MAKNTITWKDVALNPTAVDMTSAINSQGVFGQMLANEAQKIGANNLANSESIRKALHTLQQKQVIKESLPQYSYNNATVGVIPNPYQGGLVTQQYAQPSIQTSATTLNNNPLPINEQGQTIPDEVWAKAGILPQKSTNSAPSRYMLEVDEIMQNPSARAFSMNTGNAIPEDFSGLVNNLVNPYRPEFEANSPLSITPMNDKITGGNVATLRNGEGIFPLDNMVQNGIDSGVGNRPPSTTTNTSTNAISPTANRNLTNKITSLTGAISGGHITTKRGNKLFVVNNNIGATANSTVKELGADGLAMVFRALENPSGVKEGANQGNKHTPLQDYQVLESTYKGIETQYNNKHKGQTPFRKLPIPEQLKVAIAAHGIKDTDTAAVSWSKWKGGGEVERLAKTNSLSSSSINGMLYNIGKEETAKLRKKYGSKIPQIAIYNADVQVSARKINNTLKAKPSIPDTISDNSTTEQEVYNPNQQGAIGTNNIVQEGRIIPSSQQQQLPQQQQQLPQQQLQPDLGVPISNNQLPQQEMIAPYQAPVFDRSNSVYGVHANPIIGTTKDVNGIVQPIVNTPDKVFLPKLISPYEMAEIYKSKGIGLTADSIEDFGKTYQDLYDKQHLAASTASNTLTKSVNDTNINAAVEANNTLRTKAQIAPQNAQNITNDKRVTAEIKSDKQEYDFKNKVYKDNQKVIKDATNRTTKEYNAAIDTNNSILTETIKEMKNSYIAYNQKAFTVNAESLSKTQTVSTKTKVSGDPLIQSKAMLNKIAEGIKATDTVDLDFHELKESKAAYDKLGKALGVNLKYLDKEGIPKVGESDYTKVGRMLGVKGTYTIDKIINTFVADATHGKGKYNTRVIRDITPANLKILSGLIKYQNPNFSLEQVQSKLTSLIPSLSSRPTSLQVGKLNIDRLDILFGKGSQGVYKYLDAEDKTRFNSLFKSLSSEYEEYAKDMAVYKRSDNKNNVNNLLDSLKEILNNNATFKMKARINRHKSEIKTNNSLRK